MSRPKPSEEVKFETSIAMMIIASLSRLMRPQSQLTLEVFPGKWVALEPSLHFTPGLQSSACILPLVCILLILQSAFYNDRFTNTPVTYLVWDKYCCRFFARIKMSLLH